MKRLRARRALAFSAALLLAGGALSWATACSDTEVPAPVSLSGPTMLTVARTCLVGSEPGSRLRVAPSRCEEGGDLADQPAALLEFGYVPNAFGDSLAVVDFNVSPPALLDVDAATPSVTHIPVGDQPREAAASADGNVIVVYNAGSQDISLVWAESRAELLRVPLGEPALALVASPQRAAAALLLPDSRRVVEVRWQARCDGDDAIREGCAPELSAEIVELSTFPEGVVPSHMARGAAPDRLLVAFANRGHLVELWAPDPDAAPPAESPCLEPGLEAGCVVARYGLTWGCSDGLDNDGDGLIDADDPRCTSPLGAESDGGLTRLPTTACSDGLDNDGDGLIDAADDGCLSALDGDEGGGVLAATGDAPPPPPPEGSELPACNDGFDNDGDGVADLDDPACTSTLGTTEALAPAVCADGHDNDGDGLTDQDDPDCYGVSGGVEAAQDAEAFGPIAVDPGGAYLYVLNRTRGHVVVIDQATGETMDVAMPYPWDDRIGVSVGNVALSMTPRRQEVQLAQSPDGRYRITREDVLLYVATTRGLVYFVQIAEIFRAFDGEEVTDELAQPVLEVIDRSAVSASATVGACVLPDSYQSALIAQLGQVPGCGSEDLPRLVAAPSIDPEADPATLVPPVQLATARRRGYMQLNSETGLPERVTPLLPHDFFVREETWSVVWEGVLADFRDMEVQEDGYARVRATDLCASGVEVGDLVTLTTGPVPLEDADCGLFEDVDLTWRVAERTAHHLVLEPLSAEAGAALDRGEDALPLVQQAPTRACFAAGLSGQVRPVGQWIVTGSRSGRLINQTSLGEVCVPRYPLSDYTFRAETDQVFANPFVTFQVASGRIAPARDLTLTFSVDDGYSALSLSGTGPVPLDVRLVETQRGAWMPVVDGATNVVRVYDSSSFQLITVLF